MQDSSIKETFSGPSELIRLAHKVADPQGRFDAAGKWIIAQRGAWSEWLCAAISEKLKRDGQWPSDVGELRSQVMAAAEEYGLEDSLEALRGHSALRAKSRKSRKAA